MRNLTMITSKGQVTIPIHFRQRLGLTTGSKVKFQEAPDNSKLLIIEPVVNFAFLKGYLESKKKYNKKEARKVFIKDIIKGKV